MQTEQQHPKGVVAGGVVENVVVVPEPLFVFRGMAEFRRPVIAEHALPFFVELSPSAVHQTLLLLLLSFPSVGGRLCVCDSTEGLKHDTKPGVVAHLMKHEE